MCCHEIWHSKESSKQQQYFFLAPKHRCWMLQKQMVFETNWKSMKTLHHGSNEMFPPGFVMFRKKLSGSFLTSWRTPVAIPAPIPAAMPVAEAPTAYIFLIRKNANMHRRSYIAVNLFLGLIRISFENTRNISESDNINNSQ